MLKLKTVRLRHLLILLTVLGLVPIALVGAWSINSTIEQQRRELERSMLDLSRALASAVDAELDATISGLQAMTGHPALLKGDISTFEETARETMRSRPHWFALTLKDASGRMVARIGPPPLPGERVLEHGGSPEAVLSERVPVIGKLTKEVNGLPIFPVHVPVVSYDHAGYVLTAWITPDRVLEILRWQKVPEDWVVSVHDATNLRVARSRDHARTVATGISPSLAALMQKRKPEGTGISRTLDGIESITGYTRIPRHGWAVVVGAPTAHLTETMLKNLALHASGLAASLAIFIALAIYISRRIDAAILDLQEQALRLGNGQPVEVLHNRIREVDLMGQALHTASEKRMAIEKERESLMVSLTQAFESLRDAFARAEEAGRAKDNFLAVLGHELRNPLAPMVSSLDLMDARGDTSGMRERQIMRRQVDHMRRLVDDLLDLSRITQGKLEIRKIPVNLQAVLRQAVEAAQPATTGPGRGITVDAPAQIWVEGDSTRLVQVITNLLSNALRFDPTGKVSVSLKGDGHQASIVVRDEGAGMTPETAREIFKPFFQAPQSLARSSGGLGLGLAIVHSIVELHGGVVSATSSGPGMGSEFTIVLPAVATPAAQPAPAVMGSSRRPVRVLVVDDNRDAADTLAEVLRIAGHEVEVAHEARDALALISSFCPSVAILDIGLPDMDGYALARVLRSRPSDWNGKLIALTGYGQASDKAKSRDAGFDLHMTKPVDTGVLLQSIE